MTLDKEELLKNIFDSFSHLEHINADDIPAIDLYMDCLLYTSPSPRD